jgi:hypothetical protein
MIIAIAIALAIALDPIPTRRGIADDPSRRDHPETAASSLLSLLSTCRRSTSSVPPRIFA